MEGAIKVLIADDSLLVREALGRFLSNLRGVVVVGKSRDADEMIDVAPALHPDVVVMDLTMPGLDGFEATRRLKASEEAPPVVICTLLEENEDVRKAARAAGVDALVRKRDLAGDIERLLVSLARPAR